MKVGSFFLLFCERLQLGFMEQSKHVIQLDCGVSAVKFLLFANTRCIVTKHTRVLFCHSGVW